MAFWLREVGGGGGEEGEFEQVGLHLKGGVGGMLNTPPFDHSSFHNDKQ